MTSTDTLRAAIYTRQSKDTEGTGLAVARQLAEDERLCAARGWKVLYRLSDNDISASNGKPRPGFARVMRLVEDKSVDVVVVWAVDRLVRKLGDLENVIETCERTGVKLATVSGDLDLSTDQGRLVGRILASVARAEIERKGARQKLAAKQAAEAGRRWTGAPRPFGYTADHITPDPAEARAVADGCQRILAGGTVSGVMRDWTSRGLRPPQAPFGPLNERPWSRVSVTTILRNPRIAGLSVYRGDIVVGDDGQPVRGEQAPLVPEETWRAVVDILAASDRTITYVNKHGETVTRNVKTATPRGVRTLLGGIATCRCGNAIEGGHNSKGNPVYRCRPATRGDRPGPHVAIRADMVTAEVEARVMALLAQPGAVDMLVPPKPETDVAALRAEETAIRRNLNELAADRAIGLVTRDQMIAATERGTARLEEIAAKLSQARDDTVLAPFISAEDAFAVWDGLGLDRQRAVLRVVTPVILHPAGRGARTFDPATVETPGIPPVSQS